MFSGFLVRAQQWRVFASAHSRGLRLGRAERPTTSTHALPQRIRAGCDFIQIYDRLITMLCLSAFARVATNRIIFGLTALRFASAHSRGLRREIFETVCTDLKLCHSAFVRVATYDDGEALDQWALCHSAFVRVATH